MQIILLLSILKLLLSNMTFIKPIRTMAEAPSTIEYPPELAGFASIFATYEHRIGHACHAIESHIPALHTDLPSIPMILDNACGTGAGYGSHHQGTAVHSRLRHGYKAVHGPGHEGHRRCRPALQKNVVQVEVMNGQELRYEDYFFDASVMNFGIFFFPDPALGAREAYRTLKREETAVFSL